MEIQVKLDPNANPPVTVLPVHQSVNHGNQTLIWVPFANENFAFVSLTGLPNPPFSNPAVSASKITVTDNNQNNGPEVVYPYTIVVSANGTSYSSAKASPILGNGNPTINNK
ncbi:MAG: hypothetical protein ABJB02_05905 [Dokdonella sp.]